MDPHRSLSSHNAPRCKLTMSSGEADIHASNTSHPFSRLSQLHHRHTEGTDTVQTMPTHRNTTNHSLGDMGIMHPVGCCCSQCVRRTVLVHHDGHNQALPDEYNCTKIDHHPPGCCCSHCLCKHPADCTCNACNAQRPHGHNYG